MSRWHYQIMRHTADSGEDYLAVHEFYTMHDGKLGLDAEGCANRGRQLG
jgi:hypothetical protein